MSEPTTEFTVRDLNRQTAAVLAACDRAGRVRIRRRNGREYELRPVAEDYSDLIRPARNVAEIIARKRETYARLGLRPMTPTQSAELDRLIAGE
jgi:hypothetical protein